jgi:hypothetical protein
MTKNLKKFTAEKRILYFFGQKQERSSAPKREHPALQNKKFLNFFLCLWSVFALLDPDLDSEAVSRSTDLIESGSKSETLDFTKLYIEKVF